MGMMPPGERMEEGTARARWDEKTAAETRERRGRKGIGGAILRGSRT